jgi:hypothetical protein
MNVGSVMVGQEFVLCGRTFKRVDAQSWYGNGLRVLPSAVNGELMILHQNAIPVMCKDDGVFYHAECWEECELIGPSDDAG